MSRYIRSALQILACVVIFHGAIFLIAGPSYQIGKGRSVRSAHVIGGGAILTGMIIFFVAGWTSRKAETGAEDKRRKGTGLPE